MTPPGAANLAGRIRGLYRKWERGSESLFFPGLGDRARGFEKTVVIIYRRQADANQPAKQKECSDKKSRGNLNVFKEGDLVLLDTKNLSLKVVSSVESNKLKHQTLCGPGQTWRGVYH
ncbi:Pol protein [Phytophthora palmivora]|uniref:Pol protein n=1 Tax=Phytophthora palmivora TaxID=4796 RepID=A0A2P4YJI3_9STRA|nr:Pol protein [Phytophthora palmivora]